MKEGWKYAKVGQIFDTYSGGTPLKSHKEYYENGNIPWLCSGEVCRKYITSTEKYITQLGLDNSSAKYYPENTVVVAMYGATAAQVGILKCRATSNQAVCGILPNDKFLPEFVYNWFLFRQTYLASQAQGGAQPNISQIKIKNIEIPVLSLSEQQQIVDFLDAEFAKIDELKNQAEQSLQNAKDLFQAALKEMLTPKEGWKEVKLSQIGSINRGVSKHRPRNAPELMGDYLPLVQTGDVANSDKYIETYSSSYSKLGVEQSRVWEPGALCITIAANIGKASILNFKACFPDSVVGFIANPGTSIDFIYYQFCILQSILEANAPGAAQKNINLRILSELKLFVPEYKEQVRIAEKLDRLRETKNSLQSNYTRTIQLCADLKQALLRQVFE